MYRLFFSEIIKKQCKLIPKKDVEKIKGIISALENTPRPVKSRKLVGGVNDYRIRYRHWRILYSIDDTQRSVVIHGILDRKEAYR